ncbi:MAG: hypothetical protein JXR37_14255 [Kiritimatiellae bacterium]|nr:hypothetical protein [Kiritimatiellia bacterium]
MSSGRTFGILVTMLALSCLLLSWSFFAGGRPRGMQVAQSMQTWRVLE